MFLKNQLSLYNVNFVELYTIQRNVPVKNMFNLRQTVHITLKIKRYLLIVLTKYYAIQICVPNS